MGNLKCNICGNDLIKGRKKFCSMECRTVAYTGDGNPFFGKSQTEKQKLSVRNYNKNFKDYCSLSTKLKGRTITKEQRDKISNSLKEWFSKNENPTKGRKRTEEERKLISQKTRESYLKSDLYKRREMERDDYEKYYREVWRLTEQNDLSVLENSNKRSYKEYHLDHIIPIRKGFDMKIPPAEMADINNLQFLWWKDNINKRTHISCIPKHLEKYCG
jgi:predicted RNA-binding protein with RPS1 domain